MIEYDQQNRKMVLKLVYYGPALSGKTTNILKLHDLISRQERGELMVMDTVGDRTMYFDLLPFFLVAPSGLKIKLKVYTVPGQVQHDSTRNAVLQRADGVAFIADSQLSQETINCESFENLEKNLSIVGLDIEQLPLVVQFNKRDLSEIFPEEEIRQTWQATNIPIFMASALNGWGVLETFIKLAELTYQSMDQRYQLETEHGLTRDLFLAKLFPQEPE
ncbi:MAG: GTPase [Deltaproteobacteria bacterium]|nr:GTPase [Deltaproteobacteria bacterium]TLN03147.1 MAG: GTPase domain-containing protein [bacterium]